jgi:hypothetical protein
MISLANLHSIIGFLTVSSHIEDVLSLNRFCLSFPPLVISPDFHCRVCENRIQWRPLLEHFCNVKKLELDFELTLELAHFLCADHEEPALDVLPALEEIQLYP